MGVPSSMLCNHRITCLSSIVCRPTYCNAFLNYNKTTSACSLPPTKLSNRSTLQDVLFNHALRDVPTAFKPYLLQLQEQPLLLQEVPKARPQRAQTSVRGVPHFQRCQSTIAIAPTRYILRCYRSTTTLHMATFQARVRGGIRGHVRQPSAR